MTISVAHWDRVFAAGKGFRQVDPAELRLLAQHVRPVPGQRAMDVGCGLGGYAAELTGLGYRTLAIDWAEASVAAVRDRYDGVLPGLTARRLDFEDDQTVTETVPAGEFDLVTMRLVFAFISDKTATGNRVRRLLASGGAWVVTTPLAELLPAERAHIGLTHTDVGALIEGWSSGCWYDLEPSGLRCFVLHP